MSAYGALLRLYPRAFRDDYGPDMELLLRQQLQDERAVRVWGRALLDLALTVPPQHLEILMARPVSSSSLYAGVGVASLVTAVLLAATVGLSPVVGVLVAALAGLALVAWRRTRALSGSGGQRAWTYLVVGAAGLTATAISVQGRGELAAGPWTAFALALLASTGLLITGLWLLVARAGTSRSA